MSLFDSLVAAIIKADKENTQPQPQPQPQPQTLSNPQAVEQTDFQMEPRTPLSEEQIAEIFEMESDVLGGSEEESGGLGTASNFEIDPDAQTQEQSIVSEPQSQSETSQEPNQTNADHHLWDSKIKEKFEKKLAYCCSAEFDTARNKRNFIRFTLIDKNGIKVPKLCLFNYTGTKESVQNFINQIVIIDGEYKQNGTYLNLNLSSVAVVLPESAEKHGISTETFVKIKEDNPFERKPQISNESCAEQLLGYIQEMPDADYQKLLKHIFVDCKFLEAYSRIPSGLKYHHAVPGGNLQHTYEVTNIAYTLCQQFSYANPSLPLVITGAMLHDIGKVYEMPAGEEMSYTYQGYALGHIAIGISLITRYAIECNIPKVKLNALLSIIAQHHGKVENGSPVPVCSIEAMIVHCADVCSCNINHVYQGLCTSNDKVVADGNEHFIRLQV